MRLVSYNILDSGEGRADTLAEVILAQKADIVVIVEADNAEVLARIGKRLNMDYIHGQGKKSAAAIFSRWPIRDSINHGALTKKLNKSFLQATIVGPDNREWNIFAVHLHAHALDEVEAEREDELKFVLETTKALRKSKSPHLLCGDFNSNSPVQKIDIPKCKKSTQKEFIKNGSVIPRRVVQKLLDTGYVDSLHAVDPKKAETGGTFSTQHPGQRVDYVFAFGI